MRFLILCALLLSVGLARADALVSTEWLAAHLDDPQVRLFEVSVAPEQYDAGHIPGAFNLNWHTDLVDPVRRDIAPREQLQAQLRQLQAAQSLVLVFPTWWFGFPAILKGWFDRVWAPGHAYQHAADLGAITPGLLQLQEVRVVTTLGSPWWVDLFVLRRPVRRVLKLALLGACTRGCSFRMLSFYRSEKADRARVDAFVRKIRARF